jgi:predicted O-methyltransferase YrrM
VAQIPATFASHSYIERSLDSSVLFRLPGHGLTKGVNRYEGTGRSLGLMYGGLLKFVQADPLYSKARAATENLSICSEICLANIFSILKYHLHTLNANGDIIEFGSYKGGTALFMAYILNKLGTGSKVYALDTFEGMPVSSADHDTHQMGDFSDADLSIMEKKIRELGLENIVPVKGLFSDTFPKLAAGRKFALAHIDCDQYESVAYAVDCLKGHLTEGAYMIFDDPLIPTCPGALEAVEESLYHRDNLHAEQVFPHFVFRNFSGSKRGGRLSRD